MDETGDVYVADGLYDAEDDTNGIRVGASPTHGAASPPAVGQMQVDDSSRTIKTVLRNLYGGIVDLLKDRASRDKVSQEDCGQAGILEAKIWNTTDKVTYIIKLLHLAKAKSMVSIFALTPTTNGPLPDLVEQLSVLALHIKMRPIHGNLTLL